MNRDDASGVWSASGLGLTGAYYLYEVRVWAPSTQEVVTNQVTDPYSLSLSTNSARSQVVDLDSKSLEPTGWDEVKKPPLKKPEDITLYELHVRDFSANDASVPAADRGTFEAFALEGTNGTKHLKELADAGLTHVHLLPAFDFATVDEDRSTWQQPDPAATWRGSRRTPRTSRRPSRPPPARTASTGATTPGTTPCPRAATAPIRRVRGASWSSATWSRP